MLRERGGGCAPRPLPPRAPAPRARAAAGPRTRDRLIPLIARLRRENRRIRVVDVGCGIGYILRWLAARGGIGDDVELVGCDFNEALIAEAKRLAAAERLDVTFLAQDAFTLDVPADIYLSSGVLHHIPLAAMPDFFAVMGRTGRVWLGRIAVRAGLLGGLLALLVGLAFLESMAMAGGPSPALVAIGERMVRVYSAYAALIAVGFALRTIPSVDVRTLTSLLIFGPLTLTRPGVIVGGAIWGALAAPEPGAVLVTALGVACVFFVEQSCEQWIWKRVVDPEVP